MPVRNFQRRTMLSSTASHSGLGTRIKDANALEIQDLDSSKAIANGSVLSHQNSSSTLEKTVLSVEQEDTPRERPHGHVKVGVRVKASAGTEPNELALEINRAERTVRVPRSYLNSKKYTFDAVFPVPNTSEQIYREMVQPLVQQVLAGFSAAVTVFGPRGSGKTQTIGAGGNAMWEGAISFACADLLTVVRQRADWSLMASFAEVEPEGAADLLVASDSGRSGDLTSSRVKEAADRFGPKAGGLGTLVSREIKEVDECLEVVREGNRNRWNTDAATHGPQSNVIFRLQVVRPADAGEDRKWTEASDVRKSVGRRRPGDEGLVVSSILLVDLAGSERTKGPAPGARAPEARETEWHSRAVGSLVDAVSNMGGIRKNQEETVKLRGRAPLWVRETALTWLLKDALFGRAWWAVIVTVKAGGEHLKEEDSALLFGERVRLGRLRPVWNLACSWNAVHAEREGARQGLLSPNPFLKASVFHKKLAPLLPSQAAAELAASQQSSTAPRKRKFAERREPREQKLGYSRQRRPAAEGSQTNRAWEREHAELELSRYVKEAVDAQLQREQSSLASRSAAQGPTQGSSLANHAPWPDLHDPPERSQDNPFVFSSSRSSPKPPRSPPLASQQPKLSPQQPKLSPQQPKLSPAKSLEESRVSAKGSSKQAARDREALQMVGDLLDAHAMLLGGEGASVEKSLQEAERREPTRSFMQLVQGVSERPALLASLARLQGAGRAQPPLAGEDGSVPPSAEKQTVRRRLLAPVDDARAGKVAGTAEEKFVLAGEAGEAWLLQKLSGIASAAGRSGREGMESARSSPGRQPPTRVSPAAHTHTPEGRRHSPGRGRGAGEAGRGLWAELRELEWARRGDEVREAALRSVVQEAEQLALQGGDSVQGLQSALMGRRELGARVRGMRATVVAAAGVCEALLHALDARAQAQAPAAGEPRPAVTDATGEDLQAKPREAAEEAQAVERRMSWPPTGVRVLTPSRKPPGVPGLELHKVKPKVEQEVSEIQPVEDGKAAEKEALLAEFGRLRAKELVRASMGMVQGFFGTCRAELLDKKGKDSRVKQAASSRSLMGRMWGKRENPPRAASNKKR